MRKFTDSLIRTLLGPLAKGVVALMGLYTLVWGVWVANPFWNVFTTAEVYSALGGAASETFWGVLALISGAAVIWGAAKHSINSILVGSAVGWIHWVVVGTLYLFGDWHNTAGITSPFVAVYFAYIYLNVRIRSTRSDIDINDVLCD